jgi:hypothetical protein
MDPTRTKAFFFSTHPSRFFPPIFLHKLISTASDVHPPKALGTTQSLCTQGSLLLRRHYVRAFTQFATIYGDAICSTDFACEVLMSHARL